MLKDFGLEWDRNPVVRADSASVRVDSLPEQVVNLLIGARSVAYPGAVASGIYFCQPARALGRR